VDVVPQGFRPASTGFYTLGSATMFAFLSQAVTGVFLAMYYKPDASGGAYEVGPLPDRSGVPRAGRPRDAQVGRLGDGDPGSSCTWGRVFFFGAYKYPRELTWIVGVVLLILTLAMSFTGLPAAVRPALLLGHDRGRQHQRTGPLVGPYLSDFLRAGPEFGATTLSRFYAIHMMLIPGLIAVLIGLHLWLIMKLGISAPPWMKAEPEPELELERAEV